MLAKLRLPTSVHENVERLRTLEQGSYLETILKALKQLGEYNMATLHWLKAFPRLHPEAGYEEFAAMLVTLGPKS